MEREKLISLVQGVQKGDENAMTEMYNTFHNDIYYYIFKTVSDSELAADLTQDTFIEILQSIASLKEPAAFITWSRQIAYRRCTAYFKKRHDIMVDEDEDGYSIFDTIPEDTPEFIPEEALDKEDFKQTIHGIITELPEEQRSAIMMRYFEELPVSKIAKIQGVSEGTVKSRLNYGRKAIQQSVENYEKKHNIKLHCAGVIPMLLWLMREYRKANGLSITTGTATATGASAAIASATAATTATVNTAAAMTAVTVTKTIGTALIAKIAAGVVAASVAIGGIVFAVIDNHDSTPQEDEMPSVTDSAEVCNHKWSDTGNGVCILCDAICDHKDSLSSVEHQEAEGLLRTERVCAGCNWQSEEYSLTYTKNPIRITQPLEFAWECVTEQSHAYLVNLLKESWGIENDPTVTITPIGALYYYNDEWEEKSIANNRLVIIYHLDNGVVPGGWYTYLGRNHNVSIKCVDDADGSYHFSTVEDNDFNQNILSFLWIEGLKESFTIWLDTEYPTSFKYNDMRYIGHTTIEDCLTALRINAFDYFGFQFDHLIATGEMRQHISDY
jgi:RNA polymerase sigma factor (sigma-70 family)